jgi:23S rRNA pseudouridine2605 synthase
MYANLTKKNVQRGKWRYLSEKEIRLLKYMNSGLSQAVLKPKRISKSDVNLLNSSAEK